VGTSPTSAYRIWRAFGLQPWRTETFKISPDHVICDNLSTHKAPVVQRWPLAHPRFVLHFTPTYASGISQVERWFAELQRRCLERGVFCSLEELTTALESWIKLRNEGARPFNWTKTLTRSPTASAATAYPSQDRGTRQ
jgi:transposase